MVKKKDELSLCIIRTATEQSLRFFHNTLCFMEHIGHHKRAHGHPKPRGRAPSLRSGRQANQGLLHQKKRGDVQDAVDMGLEGESIIRHI